MQADSVPRNEPTTGSEAVSMNGEPRPYNVGVYQGLGRPEVVLMAWHDAFEDLPEIQAQLREAHDALIPLLQMPDTLKIVTSFCCSVLNREYRDSGICFAVDDSGKWGWTEEPNTMKRQAIWDGLVNLKY